ncbi:glycoside hydrolase family 76 protein [Xylariaceae sp. FL1272]|nr:glycoside hydrolase family 76 protein [Xylariaceae sp. FL1272]
MVRQQILAFLAWTTNALVISERCPIFFKTPKQCDPIAPKSFLPHSMVTNVESRPSQTANTTAFVHLLDALDVIQSEFFVPEHGTWPDAIDWTAAVVGTHFSGATRSVSEDLVFLNTAEGVVGDWRQASNLIDGYFAQTVAYYFGQDAEAIRNEAYDDMLWVVLGWLESVKLVNGHGSRHYADGLTSHQYHGKRWVPVFSRRAREFWEYAMVGWDTQLCNGGMIWNPRLLPYKNAITNELFVAASISMYHHFPGDATLKGQMDDQPPLTGSAPQDALYLKAAVEGYKWLQTSNMTNSQGLYIDGLHISGYLDKENNNTKCDSRDEMVFTYNQGVILTGQRGLWDATGASSYLSDGHTLVQRVINATGYNLTSGRPIDSLKKVKPGRLPKWHGLGRLGIMEEYCDASATCSADGQTFKGIFFHHLTAFCEPLEAPHHTTGLQVDERAFLAVQLSHAQACASYGGWLTHHVTAALKTRDDAGRFGQWWTAGLLIASNWTAGDWPTLSTDGIPRDSNVTDYRNYELPHDDVWALKEPESKVASSLTDFKPESQISIDRLGERSVDHGPRGHNNTHQDPNKRGRGRTVETQSGGLALLRAYWKIAQSP